MTTEKTAQGGGQNPQFERSFADLAYAYLKDKAPRLLDFLVGFQVIDKNEDETKAAGVYGFKVGNQWFYAPVFFLNGELKGNELLYIKEQDAFVPLQENWVNYLISRKPTVLGEGTSQTESDLGVGIPDFWVYQRSPLRGWDKTSSAPTSYDPSDESRYGYWCDGQKFDITPTLRVFLRSPNHPIYKEAAARMDLAKVIPELGVKAAQVIAAQIRTCPEFGEALGRFYNGSDLLPPMEKKAEQEVLPPSDVLLQKHGLDRQLFRYYATKLAGAGYNKLVGTDKTVVRVLTSLGVKSAAHLREVLPTIVSAPMVEKRAADEVGDVEIVTRREGLDGTDLTSEERSELMDEGLVVRDSRTSDQQSKVYDVNMTQELTNPDCSGLFEMISKDGKSHPVIIIKGPKTIGTGVANAVLVIQRDGKGWGYFDPKKIFVRTNQITDWKPFYEKELIDASNMEERGTYALISEDADGSLVFNVVEKAGNDLYVHVPYGCVQSDGNLMRRDDPFSYRCTIDHDFPSQDLDKPDLDSEPRDWWKHNVRPVVISDSVGRLKSVGDTLMVPSACKAFRISKASDGLDFVPGCITDAELALLKNAELRPIKVWSDGLGYQLDSGKPGPRLQRDDAMRDLILRHGVTKGAARMMLKRADEAGADTFLVKYAQGYTGAGGPLIPGPTAPSVAMLDNIKYYDQNIGALSETDQSHYEDVRLPLAGMDVYDPQRGDPPTARAAVDAARTGQKEVLDTSVLGGLVKTMDIDPVIEKYLADLVVGLDRIGRLLFMFYWHNEKFGERYGEEEMRELEDALRNTFKSVGDLVLFLKKKTVEPDAALLGSDVDLDKLS